MRRDNTRQRMNENKLENISDNYRAKEDPEILYSLTLDQIDCFNSIIDGLKDQPIRIDHFAIYSDSSVSLIFKPLSLAKLHEAQYEN